MAGLLPNPGPAPIPAAGPIPFVSSLLNGILGGGSSCGGCQVTATFGTQLSQNHFTLLNYGITSTLSTNGVCTAYASSADVATSALTISAPSPLPPDFTNQLSASFVSYVGAGTGSQACSVELEEIIFTATTATTTSSGTTTVTTTTTTSSATATSATPSPAAEAHQSGLSGGAKAGIGVGVTIAVLLLAAVIHYFMIRRGQPPLPGNEAHSDENLGVVDRQTSGASTDTMMDDTQAVGFAAKPGFEGQDVQMYELNNTGQRYELDGGYRGKELS